MPSFRWQLPFLCVLLLSTLSSWAEQPLPFGSDFAPTFSFVENYTESGEYSDDEEDFVDTTSYSLTFTATASMNGINPASFQNDGLALNVVIGNLDLSLPFWRELVQSSADRGRSNGHSRASIRTRSTTFPTPAPWSCVTMTRSSPSAFRLPKRGMITISPPQTRRNSRRR